MATPQQRGLRRRVVDWFINTGWKRLAIWLIIIFLPIVVDVLYIYKFGPEMFTGFLIDANCHAPSDEYVDWQDVTWAGWEPHILIRPNDVRYANIAIMPLDANKQACLHAQWRCDNQVNPCGPLIAWIAKREIFMQGCRPQDGLVAGEYVIDVQVTCRNGQKTVRGLRLRVDQNWNVTDITTA